MLRRPMTGTDATDSLPNGRDAAVASAASPRGWHVRWRRRLPGLLLASGLALTATLGSQQLAAADVVASPMVLALLAGLVLAQLRTMPRTVAPGLEFACRPVLRAAIVLLGLRIGLPQLSAIGFAGLAAVAAIVVLTLLFGYWVARRFGLSAELAWLLAAGHAICGAAAVAATDSVLKCNEREVAQALTRATLAGTAAMLLGPLLVGALDLRSATYGFWVGGSVHEVAQAVAAGFARGDDCGEAASLVKMVRVAFLLPLGLFLGAVVARRGGTGGRRRIVVPWFVVGFACTAAIDACGWVPAAVATGLRSVCNGAMAVAMAALGLKSSLRSVASAGVRPLAAAAATTVVVSLLALAMAARVA